MIIDYAGANFARETNHRFIFNPQIHDIGDYYISIKLINK